MPSKPGKKEVAKAQKKVVEDKTFGLKNKGKSAKVKQYVTQVAQQAQFTGKSREQVLAEQKRKAEKEALKLAKEAAEKENAAIFKGLEVSSSKHKQHTNANVDPKSILCVDFKAGNCNKGRNCKYSHDLNIERKTAKIDLYTDPRTIDTHNNTTDNKTNTDNNTTEPRKGPTLDIVCKHFLDAVEQSKYGWLWVCPNNGDYCQYKHALPPGFVLKSKQTDTDTDTPQWTVEDEIEKQRKALDLSKCKPLTLELIEQWRIEHAKHKAEHTDHKSDKHKKQADAKANKQMSGRALFAYNPNVFVDDEEVDDERYEIDASAEWSDNEELQEFKQGDAVDTVAAQIQNADLFADDLPSDGEQENKHGSD